MRLSSSGFSFWSLAGLSPSSRPSPSSAAGQLCCSQMSVVGLIRFVFFASGSASFSARCSSILAILAGFVHGSVDLHLGLYEVTGGDGRLWFRWRYPGRYLLHPLEPDVGGMSCCSACLSYGSGMGGGGAPCGWFHLLDIPFASRSYFRFPLHES